MTFAASLLTLAALSASLALPAQDFLEVSRIDGDVVEKLVLKVDVNHEIHYDSPVYSRHTQIDPTAPDQNYQIGYAVHGSAIPQKGGTFLLTLEVTHLDMVGYQRFTSTYLPSMKSDHMSVTVSTKPGDAVPLGSVSQTIVDGKPVLHSWCARLIDEDEYTTRFKRSLSAK
jgi:hypothetical protein